METTKNYNLNKVEDDDFIDIVEHFNENTEIIDDVLGKKVDVEEGKTLSDNNFTNELKEKLEQASENKHSHTNKSVLDKITQALLNAWNNAVEHINDSIKHITTDERNLWNTVKNKADSGHTHDERYYTESEIDSKVSTLNTAISGKADSNHIHKYVNTYGYRLPQTGRTQNLGGLYTYATSVATQIDAPTTYTAMIGFGNGTGGSAEISVAWNGSGGGMWYRALRDVTDDWYAWTKLLDSNNYKTYCTPANIGAAASNHTHDDRYYTESEIDSKVSILNTAISGKAASSHTQAASTITIADAAGYFSANNAEGALAEIWKALKYPNQTITGAVNWNNYMVTGIYKIQNCTMSSTYNAPVGVYAFGILVVIHPEQGGESRCYQIFIPHNNENMYYARAYNSGWGNWRCSTDHTHSYLPLSGGTVSGNLAVTGNVEATGTIKGSAIYNALWGADYAETFDFEGEQPEVGEIVEIYDKRKLRKAEENSRKVIGIVSNTYCILAGSDEKEVENGTKIAVGLLGQLPIKIIGKVEAGDFIISAGKGIGKIADENVVRGSIIGRALESNSEKNIKMVYCLIQPQ